MKEKTASDAPCWMNADEAGAWANGWNAAMEEASSAIAAIEHVVLTNRTHSALDEVAKICRGEVSRLPTS